LNKSLYLFMLYEQELFQINTIFIVIKMRLIITCVTHYTNLTPYFIPILFYHILCSNTPPQI
jgi:hypothetical protein